MSDFIVLHRQDGSELTDAEFQGWPAAYEADGRPLKRRTISTKLVGSLTYALTHGPDDDGHLHYRAI